MVLNPNDKIIITQLVEQDKNKTGFYFPRTILLVKEVTKFFLENHESSYRLHEKAPVVVEKTPTIRKKKVTKVLDEVQDQDD